MNVEPSQIILPNGLSRGAAERLRMRIPAAIERRQRRILFDLFPDHGKFRRAAYPKHMEFFDKSRLYREVGMMAANRVGKSTGAGYAVGCHTTGWYPHWWTGRRFPKHQPITVWCCGVSHEKIKEIVQEKLLGTVVDLGSRKTMSGTGLIPGEWLGRITWRQGVADVVETVKVRHIPTGRWSTIVFKSYEQGRKAYEGTNIKVIWLDEEPPADIYDECVTRTTSTTGNYEDNGLIMATFTPLEGISEVVMMFMPKEAA